MKEKYNYEDNMYLDEMTSNELERELSIIEDGILPYNVCPCFGCTCNEDDCEVCINKTIELIQEELDNRGINWEVIL